jgi:cytochrome c oxidase subunit II
MSKILKYLAATAVAACLPFAAALAEWELNMPVGVTPLSKEIYGLHMLIFWICVAIGVVVFGVMIYSIISFRHSKGAVAANFDHSTRLEIVWTIIPIGILVGMAVPAADKLIQIEDTRDSKLSVEITGYQWKWQYNYLTYQDQKVQNVSFFSTLARASDKARQLDSGVDPYSVENYLLDVDNPLIVPVNTKVRVLLTAGDVMHAWWVPAFGMKKDAIPGFVNELWFTAEKVGTYRGQCAELCGRDHGFMPVVVKVVEQAEFDQWLKDKQGAAAPAPAATASLPAAPAPESSPSASSNGAASSDAKPLPSTSLANAE